jgi:hypothetical protein
LLILLARARASTGGILLVVVGVFILFAFLVFALVSVAGNVVLVLAGTGPVIDFLGTGYGVLVGLAIAVIMILLGVAFLTRATPQPTQSVTVTQQSGTPRAERDRELEQLGKRLRRVEQERNELRARLADPTAMRRRNEEMLRERCLELAHELQNFMYGRRYTDTNETVARFQQRHEWKVNELREQLDEQGWLTPQERDILTFRADDYSHTIDDIVETLRSLGAGH